MLVNFDPAVIFIKDTKTAGTTTEAVLEEAMWGVRGENLQGWKASRAGFCPPRGVVHQPDLGCIGQILIASTTNLPISSLGRVRRLRNHSSPKDIREAVGERFWNRAIKVVNLRNPFDMEVSAYYFRLRGTLDKVRPSFTEWVGAEGEKKWDNWIANVDSTWQFIRYETLESDITSFLNNLGFATPEFLPTYKSGIRPGASRDYRAMYTPEARSQVELRHRDYLERFNYEF